MYVAYRIAKTRYSTSHELMFSGLGAALYGGRWNSRGNKMVYASESRALATLEISVHLKNTSVLESYSVCDISIPEELCEEVGSDNLPRGWDEMVINPAAAQAWGDLWLEVGETPAVRVPSVVVPLEWNFLLNPDHDNFPGIQLGRIQPHPIDHRIKGNPPVA